MSERIDFPSATAGFFVAVILLALLSMVGGYQYDRGERAGYRDGYESGKLWCKP